MQHYLIIRQSPKPSVRCFPRPHRDHPLRFTGAPPIAVPWSPFPSLRDCVIGSCLSCEDFRVCITSFATNTPSRRKPPRPTAKETKNRTKDPPVPIRFTPLRPWSSPTRAGTFPPDSVSVCVSVCSQPPGGSIPPILRADCLTRRGQVPLPKTLSPPTRFLFLNCSASSRTKGSAIEDSGMDGADCDVPSNRTASPG